MSNRIIRVSEINQYVYCAKAWWLGAMEGVVPTNIREIEMGTLAHTRHGQDLIVASRMQRAAIGLFVIGAALAVAWFAGGG